MNICPNCVENNDFSSWIISNGSEGHCDYNPSHGENNAVILLDVFVSYIDEWFKENYKPIERYYPIEDIADISWNNNYQCILEREIGCDSNLVEMISEILEKTYNSYDGCSEIIYDRSNEYQSLQEEYQEYLDENKIPIQWKYFCDSVKYNGRFFNIAPKLDELLESEASYNKIHKSPLITIKSKTKIFRARKLHNDLTEECILKNPKEELGYFDCKIAIAGRMNVQYIPVFYGAFTADIAVIETQPYIGENIAVGKFTLNKDIKVFDFTVYANIPHLNEIQFDENEVERIKTIRHIHDEISKPIPINNKSLDYIPTQVLAEYVKEKFNIDGIIYYSSMVSPNSPIDKRNIMLFTSLHDGTKLNEVLSIQETDVKFKNVKSIKHNIGLNYRNGANANYEGNFAEFISLCDFKINHLLQ